MSRPPVTPTIPITLRSPAELLAVIPHILGFQPTSSIVILTMRGQHLGLTMRNDLPEPAQTEEVAALLMQPLRREDPDRVLLIGYEERPGQSMPVIDALNRRLGEAGIEVQDRIVVHSGRWRSLTCSEPGCCPIEGSVIPTAAEAAHVTAEFVGAGIAPAYSRTELAARLEAGSAAVEVAEILSSSDTLPGIDTTGMSETVDDPPSLEQHRACQALARAWSRVLDPTVDAFPLEQGEVAIVVASLRDIAIRDGITALLMPDTLTPDLLAPPVRHLVDRIRQQLPVDIGDPDAHRGLQERLIGLCAGTPDTAAAPPLTVLAAYAWWRGDGATAAIAVARALRCEPGYRLARLLDLMLENGIRPTRE